MRNMNKSVVGYYVKRQSEPEEVRDVAGRDGGVNWCFVPVYSTGDFGDTGSSWLQIEREARSLAEASPRQAESLAAGVQPMYHSTFSGQQKEFGTIVPNPHINII